MRRIYSPLSSCHCSAAPPNTLVLRFHLLCYILRKPFGIMATYCAIALWVGLDSNERVFWNLIYSQAASTPYLPTHKTIELLRMTTFSNALWVGLDLNERLLLGTEFTVRRLKPLTHRPTKQSNHSISTTSTNF